MLRFLTPALLATALCAQPGGWQSLFDGKTMDRFDDPRLKTPPGDAWTIEEGCLKARANPRITEDLFTRDTFRDFELEFEWRIAPGGNSGVKYLIQDHAFLLDAPARRFEDLVNRSLERRRPDRPAQGQDYVIGFEYQLIDDARNSDAKNGPLHQTGALYDMLPPARAAARPAGEFNHTRIVVRGAHIEHWLNGVKVVDANLGAGEVEAHSAKRWGAGSPVYNLLVKRPRRDCPISLQNHGADTWFRNIRIRRMG
ncbi:MAG: DUF1080 domain-containing protein [Acidobacteriota bacterium]